MSAKFIALGVYFGYPECCTKSFIEQPVYERSLVQKSVHKNHGFIPCHECAMKIVNGEETLEGLIKNRVCRTPFPDEGSQEDSDAFVFGPKKEL